MLSEKPSLEIKLHNTLTAVGFMRLSAVLKIYPVSKTTWYDGVKSGRYPSPVKLSVGTSAWESAKILELIENVKRAGGAE